MRWAVVLLAVVLASCGERAPARAPDISGQITRATTGVTDGSRRIMVLVEAVPNDLSGSPKALVTVDSATRIFRASGSAKVEDLLPGAMVSVWFDGPVAESYPVQARAGTLLITTDADAPRAAPPRSARP